MDCIGTGPSGLKTGKYSRVPKSILKPSSSHDANTDGNISGMRNLQTSASPFRTDNSLGSMKKTHLAKKPAGTGNTSSFA